MSNLLCIDWDWFFPNPVEAAHLDDTALGLYDWGHAESPIFLSSMLWETRAAAFFQHDVPLPGVARPEGGWDAFWSRFSFAEDVVFEYADSNAVAGLMVPPDGSAAFEQVLLFDAHHDSGYRVSSFLDYLRGDGWTCEDWMLEHQRRGTTDLLVRYPEWKPRGVEEQVADGSLTRLTLDDGLPVDEPVFDTVFVCRSGAWVPTWCDTDFLDFVDSAPFDGEQVDDGDLRRDFDPVKAQWAGERMGELFAGMRAPSTHDA